MVTDERIITVTVITTNEKDNGLYSQELIEKSKGNSIAVEAVLGDRTYSVNENIVYNETKEIGLYARFHP